MKKRVSEINIVPVRPKYGLIAFTSFILYEELYMSHVAIYTRLGGGIRLLYPRRKNLDVCHPISQQLGEAIEQAVSDEMERLGLI